MLQIAVSHGQVHVVEVPEPVLRPGGVLVRNSHSLISVGTESAGLGGGGGESLLVKAMRNPALVKKVLDRVSSHGLKNTAELVRARLTTDQAAGYSCAGVVLEAAPDVADLRVGDRVACAGAGYANHAAVNFVPKNLVARLPDAVSFEEGAFATLSAIALHGVRRCQPTLGETVVVLGLGLVGQLTAQLARAAGAVVLGVDLHRERVDRALGLGMSGGFAAGDRDFVQGVLERTGGQGADAVIVTAAGGDSALLDRSFEACRKKGRVVLVGDVPIRIRRDRIYKKEIDFFVSTSYGPGRYDPEYEERGHDYPLSYVRWTEGRNLEEVVRLIATGALAVRPLVDGVYSIEDAPEAYATVASDRRPIGVLLDYHLQHLESSRETRPDRVYVPRRLPARETTPGKWEVGVVGFGSYFRSVLLPLLRSHPGFELASVCSRDGLAVRRAVERDGFSRGTTDYGELVSDPDVRVVFVTTRHDRHYPVARAAIEAGKAVFVEKPMTMTAEEGRALADLVAERKGLLTVGFNRRFSPHAQMLKTLLAPIAEPKRMLYRVNADALPPDHWLLDPVEGGGRLLGEGVHFFDFLGFLAGARPRRVHAVSVPAQGRDDAIVTLEFEDGSIGTVLYTGAGSPAAGKERVEVFSGKASFVIEDYRSLRVFGVGARGLETRRIEKGQREQLENFWRALQGQEDLQVTAEDGYWATWCARQAVSER